MKYPPKVIVNFFLAYILGHRQDVLETIQNPAVWCNNGQTWDCGRESLAVYLLTQKWLISKPAYNQTYNCKSLPKVTGYNTNNEIMEQELTLQGI